MSEKSNKILLPEAGQPIIDAIGDHNDTGFEVQITNMPLRSENGSRGALDRLVAGEFAAVIAGANHSSAEVIKAGLDVIGSEDGLISSFFAMEKREYGKENRIFLADCAVVPAPTPEIVTKIAEQTCTNVEKLGIKPVVAFLVGSEEQITNGSNTAGTAVDLFTRRNPARQTIGSVSWSEAKDENLYAGRTGLRFPNGQQPNVFVFPGLNSGNIVYKVLQDPHAGNWRLEHDSSEATVLEKNGRQIVLTKPTKRLNVEELLQIAENTYATVKDPVVAFLSFSTEGSSGHHFATDVQDAAEKFRRNHPEVITYGEMQWDSATDEHIYALKTGKKYVDGKLPNVFVFPDDVSGSTVRSIMQESGAGGMTAVGPMLQGFKKGILLIDLSRGVNEEAGLAVVKLTGQLAGLHTVSKTDS